MQSEERIKTLIKQLNYHTSLYDEGKPQISDKEWDDMYFELVSLEEKTGIKYEDSPTQRVNFTVLNELTKVTHDHPMLSLDKTKDIEDVKTFIGTQPYVAMCKMDGLTCSLTYENGKLISAETRGDGHVGEDILHNAIAINNIPKVISYRERLVIDGEVICDYFNFKKFEKDYKNPRNFAAGSIRLLDSKESHSRGLSFIAWDVVQGFEELQFLSEKLNELDILGFYTVPLTFSSNVMEDVEYLKAIASGLQYPIDGIVFKYDNIDYYYAQGMTDHHFKGGLAYKFYDESYETTLTDIEWSIGRTGQITPIAIYEDIDIDGSICNRASLHNLSVMNDTLGTAYVGQPIKVFKANMIIPQISWAKPIEEFGETAHILDKPTHCPICGQPTIVKDNDGIKTLWCENKNCEGQLLNSLDHFVGKKGLDVKGLSKATLEKLIDWGWVNNRKDIFVLSSHAGEWKNKPGFGEKSVDKILSAIEISKQCTLENFISSIGIPLIGTTVSKELAKIFDSYQEFRNYVDTDDCWFDEFDGFGPEMDKSLKEFDYTEADEIAEMLTFKKPDTSIKSSQTDTAAGLIFCITGKSAYGSRDKVKAMIEAAGGKVSSSVTTKTNYLLANKEENTSKYNNAIKYGIQIINDEKLAEILGKEI